ncbi:Cytoplasmic FMR1-interacting protein [Trichinella spiralis]|uniref:Cytoplasmic FMR1-interacting protein n=1 Tax=Trichinella spiralis TaxID=6334 RepID=A0ABR3KKH2_TRISP
MSGEVVSFADAIGNVELLDEIPLPDCQPVVEALPQTLRYRANFDANFEDRSAFITGISKYIEEATRHAELNEILLKGNVMLLIYTLGVVVHELYRWQNQMNSQIVLKFTTKLWKFFNLK